MAKKAIPQLNQSHCDCLTNVSQSCCKTRELIRKLKEAGVDVEDFERQNDYQQQMADKLKAAFFPDQP